MIIRYSTSTAAALVAALAAGASSNAAPAGEATAGIATVGYSSCDDACTAGAACTADGSCSPGGNGHGYRCGCPECSNPSLFEEMCITLGIKKRETLHDHSTWAINHYRHLHHPKCPPYCHPSYGYYQTCWSRFPEEALYCPECPSDVCGVESIPTTMPPLGPAVAPPPTPAATLPAPAAAAPAPLPEPAIESPMIDAPATSPPRVEDPAYAEPPADMTHRPASPPATVQYASVAPRRDLRPASRPVRLKPTRNFDPPAGLEPPMDPSNRWRVD